jgi:hypothetical protein
MRLLADLIFQRLELRFGIASQDAGTYRLYASDSPRRNTERDSGRSLRQAQDRSRPQVGTAFRRSATSSLRLDSQYTRCVAQDTGRPELGSGLPCDLKLFYRTLSKDAQRVFAWIWNRLSYFLFSVFFFVALFPVVFFGGRPRFGCATNDSTSDRLTSIRPATVIVLNRPRDIRLAMACFDTCRRRAASD